MLNPPLSLLSNDLLSQIVEHIAIDLPFEMKSLKNLSIVDRAFTGFCQAYIFKELQLGTVKSGTKNRISKQLAKIGKILDKEPSFANRVRKVHLMISHKANTWLFKDPTFINIVHLLGKSPIPPHTLDLSGLVDPFMFQDPILIVGQLMQTFFSQTLTVLRLTDCKNVPSTIFLVCPRLRDVLLNDVEVTEQSYDKYPDEQCSDRELPALERLDYRNSEGLVQQMITPPPRFKTGVVLWSKLRVLELSPCYKTTACLQPILDGASNNLEELYLINPGISDDAQVFLPGLVNLKDLSRLRVFAGRACIKCGVRKSAVLGNIIIVLSTIPTSNQVTTLSLRLSITGKRPFRACLEDDWAGLCNEIIRISAGKPLKLDLSMLVEAPNLEYPPPGQTQFHESMLEKIASLSDYPHISLDFWRPDPEEEE